MALTDEDKAWLSQRFEAIDQKFEEIDRKFDAVDQRFDAIDRRFDRLEDYILQFRSEAIRRFEIIDNRLDFLAGSFHRIDLQIPTLNKSVSDFGTSAGLFARDQMLAKERDADIVSRLAKLEEQMRKLHPAA
ncbi:MAG TPA: hypothetical protein VHW09_07645 [Bryobacteraceae bacterium]|jgi:hypothetical protein|nr:hypothetical protein [Bryobacteraceae bacterium]